MPVTREQFERFVQERKYLLNVSPQTILIYRVHSLTRVRILLALPSCV